MIVRIPTDRTIAIANRGCAYCCRPLDRRSRTRDHLLARKFVPEGTLESGGNIGLWSCPRCNTHKSLLEDDISAITMLPGTDGSFARDDIRLRRSAHRKAQGSVSAATGRRVSRSSPHAELKIPARGCTMNFALTGHPQIDEDRAAMLAWYQIQGLYYFQSFSRERGVGKSLSPGLFRLVGLASRHDWGNAQLRAFADKMDGWELQSYAVLADGYFRACIRGADAETLAWAVEWNAAFRCFGFWGPAECVAAEVARLPALELEFLLGDAVNGMAVRGETPLAPGDDHLFDWPPEMQTAATPQRGHWQAAA